MSKVFSLERHLDFEIGFKGICTIIMISAQNMPFLFTASPVGLRHYSGNSDEVLDIPNPLWILIPHENSSPYRNSHGVLEFWGDLGFFRSWEFPYILESPYLMDHSKTRTKNHVIFLGGGGVIKRSFWITWGRGGVYLGPKKDHMVFECSLRLNNFYKRSFIWYIVLLWRNDCFWLTDC